MRHLVTVLALCFFFGIPAAAVADNFALYSDACWHKEAGDLLGTRIGIVRLSDAPYVFLQAAGGDWNAPFIAKASAKDLKQGTLVFSISDGGKSVSFRGTITEKTVTGLFNGWFGDKGKPLTVRLSRVPVAKKGAPDCR